MAVPSKWICLQAFRQAPCRNTRRFQPLSARSMSATVPCRRDEEVQQAEQVSDAALDELASQPGVKYTMTEETEDLSRSGMDNISSLAYREIEQHKEMRELARIAAWEMPLLSQLAKPFRLPEDHQVLRWRTTTYLGEPHPAARKVVVEFQPEKLKMLNPQQRDKLLKLAGPRYNPSTKTIKISCESFETQAQNKRYLADTIRALVAEAQDLESDSFVDVPLDLRHHRPKPRPEFPKSWVMTPERKSELEAARRTSLLEEGSRVEKDAIVSGLTAIELAMRENSQREKQTVAVGAKPLGRGGPAQRKR